MVTAADTEAVGSTESASTATGTGTVGSGVKAGAIDATVGAGADGAAGEAESERPAKRVKKTGGVWERVPQALEDVLRESRPFRAQVWKLLLLLQIRLLPALLLLMLRLLLRQPLLLLLQMLTLLLLPLPVPLSPDGKKVLRLGVEWRAAVREGRGQHCGESAGSEVDGGSRSQECREV